MEITHVFGKTWVTRFHNARLLKNRLQSARESRERNRGESGRSRWRRVAQPDWCKREQAWRTNVGGRSKYFRGILRHDKAGIATAFAAYLSAQVEQARPPKPTAVDIAVAFVSATRGIRYRTRLSHSERLVQWCQWPSPTDPEMIGGRVAEDRKTSDLTKPLASWMAAGLSDDDIDVVAKVSDS